MGLILDSSIVIAAERRGDTVEKLIEQVVRAAGDQDAALSSVGLTELVHGIYRAQTPERRLRRQSFVEELLRDLTVYPYTKETATLAGKIDGEQQAQGVTVPFADLLIGQQRSPSASLFSPSIFVTSGSFLVSKSSHSNSYLHL
jgi:predicted nucleic acid-binding protein